MKRIGVAIATTGDDPRLKDTIHSIAAQDLHEGDIVYITVDGKPAWDIKSYINKWLYPVVRTVYSETPKRSSAEWGHKHMNDMFDVLALNVDIVLAQDQDDIFAPRAFEVIRRDAEDGHLLMTRVYNHAWGLLWRKPDWDEALDEANPGFTAEGFMALDGHCPAIPAQERMPHFGLAYAGDQELIQACRLMFWNKVKWVDTISTITRPRETLGLSLYPIRVSTMEHVEALRRARNSCREFMTAVTREITWNEQQEWWNTLDKKNHWAWLFVNPQNTNDVVGFVFLRADDDGLIRHTYGLTPMWRGKGYGRELVQFSVLAAQDTLLGEVLEDNVASWKINEELGAKALMSLQNIKHYMHAWPPKFLAEKGKKDDSAIQSCNEPRSRT
jgi:RimJ/RimL family protein N-acetyltransferase